MQRLHTSVITKTLFTEDFLPHYIKKEHMEEEKKPERVVWCFYDVGTQNAE